MGDMLPAPTNDQVRCRGLALRSRQGPLPVGGVNPVLPAALQDRMRGNEASLIENANLIWQLVLLHTGRDGTSDSRACEAWAPY